jgi:hypothetical protein
MEWDALKIGETKRISVADKVEVEIFTTQADNGRVEVRVWSKAKDWVLTDKREAKGESATFVYEPPKKEASKK